MNPPISDTVDNYNKHQSALADAEKEAPGQIGTEKPKDYVPAGWRIVKKGKRKDK